MSSNEATPPPRRRAALTPEELYFLATLRSLSPEGQKKLHRTMEEILATTSTPPYGRMHRKEHK